MWVVVFAIAAILTQLTLVDMVRVANPHPAHHAQFHRTSS
jgi:hypothetical protein